MKKLTVFLSLLIIGLVSNSVLAQDQQQKDKDTLIKAARFLENKPFDKDAKGIRAWAAKYVIETDQVSVTVCGGDLMKPILDKKNKNGTKVIGQYIVGMAAFKLENPDKKNDENAAQLAGLESVLKAYEAMIKEKPKTSHDGMDDLIVRRDKSELKGLVDAADCTGKK
jgi:hypothetical protein